MSNARKSRVPYGGKAPFQKHSITSEASATQILVHSKSAKSDIWKYLLRRDRRGATDEMIQKELKINPSTQRPRRRELVLEGFVRDSGETGITGSGRKATIWIAILPRYTPTKEVS